MLSEGSTVGTYRVLRKLGAGGMGAVFAAEHMLLGRKAAIKVLLPQLSQQQEIVQRFFNEARAVTQVGDPGIVQIFDFGYHTDGSAFIVMELLDGESMERRLDRIGRFAPDDAVRLARLMCATLAVAHSKGIVHRDLKPENIFIVADAAVPGGERAKLLDFGIAKLTAEDPGVLKTRTGMILGTPVYMSPEQCRSAANVDARSDIYSMGCVLMTMVTGQPPFMGPSAGDLIAAHLREPPPYAAARVPGLPRLLDEMMQRCLAKPPTDRFQTMDEVVHVLGHIEHLLQQARSSGARTALFSTPQRATPVQTTIGSAAGQVANAGTRRRGLRAAVALSGAILAVVIAISLTRKTGTDAPEAPAPVAGSSATIAPPSGDPAQATGVAPPAASEPPSSEPTPGSAAAMPLPPIPATATDAGVAQNAEPIVDAGENRRKRAVKVERKPSPEKAHAAPSGPSGSNAATTVDRSD